MSLPPGTILGRYEVRALLGAGGMGEVYLANDSGLHRAVAIKVIASCASADPDRLLRFEREAQVVSRLNHPNILTIYEVGAEAGHTFIVSEFVEGETLRQRLARGPLQVREALEIAIQIGSALASAHTASIVHRDIKPENIMLRNDGLVKVLDFGLAKALGPQNPEAETRTLAMAHTTPGIPIGTYAYMSPEQARGYDVDGRTDLFSLGAVLFEMLTGQSPFQRGTAMDVIAAVLTAEPSSLHVLAPAVPDELDRIVSRMLRKDPHERYQSAQDFKADLETLAQSLKAGTEAPHRTAAPLSAAPLPAAAIPPRAKRRVAVGISALLLVAGVLTAYRYFRTGSSITSIAVLPFVNVSRDPQLEYLSDGLSERLTDALSLLPQLKVIARGSAFRYKGKEVDPRAVGKALGVRAIVMGRVVPVEGRLQISAELVDAVENIQIWGEHYDRLPADLQALQEEMARTISDRLRLRLTAPQEQQLARRPTQNAEAYQRFLAGVFYGSNGGWALSRKAIDCFEEALTLDPSFALAYARESIAYRNLAIAVTAGLDSRAALDKAASAANRALQLDPSLPDAYIATAIVKVDQWDWRGADAAFRKALQLNPNSAMALSARAAYLSTVGRHAEAREEIRKALLLDPLSLTLRAQNGFLLMLAKQFDEAIQVLQQVVEAHPDASMGREYLALSYGGKGDYRKSIEEYRTFLSLDQPYTFIQALLGHDYVMAGRRKEGLAILGKLNSSREYVSPVALSTVYIALGDKKAAYQQLEKGYTARDNQMQYVKSIWFFDPLRADPEFQDLLRRVGFPD